MAGGGLGQPDEGGKFGGLLLFSVVRCLGQETVGRFPTAKSFSGGGAWPGFIVDDKGYWMEVRRSTQEVDQRFQANSGSSTLYLTYVSLASFWRRSDRNE